MTALIVCIRFSAWSHTIDRSDSKTSFVTSIPSRPNRSNISSPTLVWRSWNAGRQCMNFTCRVAGLRDELGVDLVGREQLDPLVPDGLVLAHRDPDVRVEVVDALHALVGVLRQRDPGAGVARRSSRQRRDEVVVRPEVPSARTAGRPSRAWRRRPAASRPCCCGRRRGSSTRSGSAACPMNSVIVRTSARIWVGWNSSVRPFQTGTPANSRELLDDLLAEAAVLDRRRRSDRGPGRCPSSIPCGRSAIPLGPR